jgi:hypothetical protein
MNTREAVAMMMQENTGRHMLDSGFSGGRRWEQLAGVNMDNLPTSEFGQYGYTQSMYHYLVDNLTLNRDLTTLYHEYDGADERRDVNYFVTITEWLEDVMGYDVEEVINTYNFENTIDGVFQAWRFEDANGDEHIAIQTHNGADVRGGYSKPFIFDYKNGDYYEFLGGLQNANVYCDSCANRWWTDYANGWESDETDFKPDSLWNNETGFYTCTCGGSIKGGY